jgi:hypothetical protein
LDKIEFPKNVEWTEMKEPIWIMDDVIRNGYTMTKVIEECKNRGYEEIKTMTIFDSLLDKAGLKNADLTYKDGVPVYTLAINDANELSKLFKIFGLEDETTKGDADNKVSKAIENIAKEDKEKPSVKRKMKRKMMEEERENWLQKWVMATASDEEAQEGEEGEQEQKSSSLNSISEKIMTRER